MLMELDYLTSTTDILLVTSSSTPSKVNLSPSSVPLFPMITPTIFENNSNKYFSSTNQSYMVPPTKDQIEVKNNDSLQFNSIATDLSTQTNKIDQKIIPTFVNSTENLEITNSCKITPSINDLNYNSSINFGNAITNKGSLKIVNYDESIDSTDSYIISSEFSKFLNSDLSDTAQSFSINNPVNNISQKKKVAQKSKKDNNESNFHKKSSSTTNQFNVSFLPSETNLSIYNNSLQNFLSSQIPENLIEASRTFILENQISKNQYFDDDLSEIFSTNPSITIYEPISHIHEQDEPKIINSHLSPILEIENLFSTSPTSPILSQLPSSLPSNKLSNNLSNFHSKYNLTNSSFLNTHYQDLTLAPRNSIDNDFNKVLNFFESLLLKDSNLGNLSQEGFWMANASYTILQNLQIEIQKRLLCLKTSSLNNFSQKKYSQEINHSLGTLKAKTSKNSSFNKTQNSSKGQKCSYTSSHKIKKLMTFTSGNNDKNQLTSYTNDYFQIPTSQFPITSSTAFSPYTLPSLPSLINSSKNPSSEWKSFKNKLNNDDSINSKITLNDDDYNNRKTPNNNDQSKYGHESDFPRFVCGSIDRRDAIDQKISLKLKDVEKNSFFCKVEMYPFNCSFLNIKDDILSFPRYLNNFQKIQISCKKSGIPHRVWRDAYILSISEFDISANLKFSNQEMKSITLKLEDFIPPLYPCLEPFKGSWRLQPKILESNVDLYVGACLCLSTIESPYIFNDCVIQKCYFDEKHAPRNRSRPNLKAPNSPSIVNIQDNEPTNLLLSSSKSSSTNHSQSNSSSTITNKQPKEKISSFSTQTTFINNIYSSKDKINDISSENNKESNKNSPKLSNKDSINSNPLSTSILEGCTPSQNVRWIRIFYLASRKQELLAVNELVHYKMPYDVHPHLEEHSTSKLATLKSFNSNLIWVIPRLNFDSIIKSKYKNTYDKAIDNCDDLLNNNDTNSKSCLPSSPDNLAESNNNGFIKPDNAAFTDIQLIDVYETTKISSLIHSLIFIDLDLVPQLSKVSYSKLLQFLHPELFSKEDKNLNPNNTNLFDPYWFLIDDELHCNLSIWDKMNILENSTNKSKKQDLSIQTFNDLDSIIPSKISTSINNKSISSNLYSNSLTRDGTQHNSDLEEHNINRTQFTFNSIPPISFESISPQNINPSTFSSTLSQSSSNSVYQSNSSMLPDSKFSNTKNIQNRDHKKSNNNPHSAYFNNYEHISSVDELSSVEPFNFSPKVEIDNKFHTPDKFDNFELIEKLSLESKCYQNSAFENINYPHELFSFNINDTLKNNSSDFSSESNKRKLNPDLNNPISKKGAFMSETNDEFSIYNIDNNSFNNIDDLKSDINNNEINLIDNNLTCITQELPQRRSSRLGFSKSNNHFPISFDKVQEAAISSILNFQQNNINHPVSDSNKYLPQLTQNQISQDLHNSHLLSNLPKNIKNTFNQQNLSNESLRLVKVQWDEDVEIWTKQ